MMRNLKNLSLGIILFILIIITSNSFTGNVVKSNSIRYSFTWINILFFFLVMVFVIWLINYVKSGDKHKTKKNTK